MQFKNWDGLRRLQAKGRKALSRAVDPSRENNLEELEPRRLLAAAAGPRFAAVPPRANLPGINKVPAGGKISLQRVQQALSKITTTARADRFDYTQGIADNEGPLTDVSSPLISLPTFRTNFPGVDGTGYSVVVIDTGIDRNHPFFGPDLHTNGTANGIPDGIADRIVFSYDFFGTDDADASDFNGHGSNVTSIALSSDATFKGMAPGANIIHLKVFPDGSGGAPNTDTEQALQWCIANAAAYNIVSVNLSLGGSTNNPFANDDDSRNDEFAQLVALNIIPVVASGNSFFTFGSAQGVTYPASDPNVISVGAVYDSGPSGYTYGSGAVANSSGADRIAPFSNRHSYLTHIMAPGAPITGANHTGGTSSLHGTSQAAPHIAGIVALAQQLAVTQLGRRLTMDEMRSLLASAGVIVNDGDDENDNVTNTGLNFPRVNVSALGNAIMDMRLGSIAGTAYEDRDSNGSKAVGEPALTRTVYLDHNNNDTLDSATTNVASSDIPKTIVDLNSFRSNLTVASLGPITDLNATVNISHTNDTDVNVYLISPSGSRVKLFTDVGGSGDNFTNTTLDDEAGTNITAGSAPFSASYKPEELLSKFDNEDPNGDWKLEVSDDNSGAAGGTLNSWSLTIGYAEKSTVTNGSGAYTFASLRGKPYVIRQVGAAGYIQNTPTGPISMTLAAAQAATNQNFGSFPISFAGSSAADSYDVSLLSGGTTVRILETLGANPVITYTIPKTTLAANAITLNGGTGDDAFTVDHVNGAPVSGGISITGGGHTTGDSLTVSGGSGADSMTLASTTVSYDGTSITTGGLEAMTFNGQAGNDILSISTAAPVGTSVTFNGGLTPTDQDVLNVNDGTYTFASDANTSTANLSINVNGAASNVVFNSTQHLKDLSVTNGTATMPTNGARVLVTNTVSTSGTGRVQLNDNDMIVRGMSYAAVEPLVKAGFAGSTWTGTGITSATAASTAARALAIADNAQTNHTTFSGQSVSGSDILIKFTYVGDANLDGLVTPDDFTLFVTGFSGGQAKWVFGDFDYNGFVNPDDFTLFVGGLGSFNASGGQQL